MHELKLVSCLNQDDDGLDFPLQLEFEVVGAGGKDSFIAVDDVFLSPHPCEAQGLYQPQQNEEEKTSHRSLSYSCEKSVVN